jgi:hypothetical protein
MELSRIPTTEAKIFRVPSENSPQWTNFVSQFKEFDNGACAAKRISSALCRRIENVFTGSTVSDPIRELRQRPQRFGAGDVYGHT